MSHQGRSGRVSVARVLGFGLCAALLLGGVVIAAAQGVPNGTIHSAASTDSNPGKGTAANDSNKQSPATPAAPQAGGANPNQGSQPKSWDLYVLPDQMKMFEDQGHSRSDVYTAASLEKQTGVPMERWLSLRKEGKDWPAAIAELAAGMKLERAPRMEGARNLTEEEIRALVDQGVRGDDILAVGEILSLYGGDYAHLIRRHQNGESWEAIREEAEARRSAELAKKSKDEPVWFALGADGKGTKTLSGLTKDEVRAFLVMGYALDEIMQADTFAHAWGVDLREAVSAKRNDQSLLDALREVESRRSAAKGDPATKIGDTCTPLGLTEQEAEELIARGDSRAEVLDASALAYALGLDMRQVIAGRRAGEGLKEAVDRADRARSQAERRAKIRGPRPDEETLVALYAQKTGKSAAEVRAERAAGKAWAEIEGIRSADGLPTQYDLADSWGITDHRIVEDALQRGLTMSEVHQGDVIADATGMPLDKVLAMKSPDITWDEIISELWSPPKAQDQSPHKP